MRCPSTGVRIQNQIDPCTTSLCIPWWLGSLAQNSNASFALPCPCLPMDAYHQWIFFLSDLDLAASLSESHGRTRSSFFCQNKSLIRCTYEHLGNSVWNKSPIRAPQHSLLPDHHGPHVASPRVPVSALGLRPRSLLPSNKRRNQQLGRRLPSDQSDSYRWTSDSCTNAAPKEAASRRRTTICLPLARFNAVDSYSDCFFKSGREPRHCRLHL